MTVVNAKYHELSYKILNPPSKLSNSDFGFSIGYQTNNGSYIGKYGLQFFG